jgi:hypothetical protein
MVDCLDYARDTCVGEVVEQPRLCNYNIFYEEGGGDFLNRLLDKQTAFINKICLDVFYVKWL